MHGHHLQVCQPRDAGAASLIRLDITSHPASEARMDGDRVPAGLEFWSVDVRITQLEVVFLNRLLQVSNNCHLVIDLTSALCVA